MRVEVGLVDQDGPDQFRHDQVARVLLLTEGVRQVLIVSLFSARVVLGGDPEDYDRDDREDGEAASGGEDDRQPPELPFLGEDSPHLWSRVRTVNAKITAADTIETANV